jgi:hypothetical protein
LLRWQSPNKALLRLIVQVRALILLKQINKRVPSLVLLNKGDNMYDDYDDEPRDWFQYLDDLEG